MSLSPPPLSRNDNARQPSTVGRTVDPSRRQNTPGTGSSYRARTDRGHTIHGTLPNRGAFVPRPRARPVDLPTRPCSRPFHPTGLNFNVTSTAPPASLQPAVSDRRGRRCRVERTPEVHRQSTRSAPREGVHLRRRRTGRVHREGPPPEHRQLPRGPRREDRSDGRGRGVGYFHTDPTVSLDGRTGFLLHPSEPVMTRTGVVERVSRRDEAGTTETSSAQGNRGKTGPGTERTKGPVVVKGGSKTSGGATRGTEGRREIAPVREGKGSIEKKRDTFRGRQTAKRGLTVDTLPSRNRQEAHRHGQS